MRKQSAAVSRGFEDEDCSREVYADFAMPLAAPPPPPMGALTTEVIYDMFKQMRNS